MLKKSLKRGLKGKKPDKGKKDKDMSRRVNDKESSSDTEDMDSDISDDVGRVKEIIGCSAQSKLQEPRVILNVWSRDGGEYLSVR